LVQAGPSTGSPGVVDRVVPAAALPDLDSQVSFCRSAERCGIESLLVDINYGKPDPLVLSLALALSVDRMRFMVAARPGLMSPTLFVQQVNTFSALTGGRISLNVVAGHSPGEQKYYGDHLDHDERYARLEEWLSICHAFWTGPGPVDFSGRFYRIEGGRLNTPFVAPDRSRPEIYLGGNSDQAKEAAARHADCWMRFGAAPAAIGQQAASLVESGVDVGLRLSIFCNRSREAALRSAMSLQGAESTGLRARSEDEFVRRTDALSMQETYAMAREEWLTPWLWTGLVRTLGAPWVCLLGTPADIVEGLLQFRDAGVSQFILSGSPASEELLRFGEEVLPLLRKEEGRAAMSGSPPSGKSA
jgi:alkanesulfonate monooxygenase